MYYFSGSKYRCIYLVYSDQSWSWLDGSKVTFVKWENKSSSDKSNSDGGKCSVLLASTETWKKVDCSHGYGRVVCQVPLSKYIT